MASDPSSALADPRPWARWARLPLLADRFAAPFIAFAALAVLGVTGAGYLPRSWRLAGFAFFALAVATLVGRRRIVVSRAEWIFLAALCGLAGWTALSAAWSNDPTTSLLEAERDLLYVAGILALLLVARRTAVVQLLAGAVAGVTAVAAYGVASYLFYGRPLDAIQGRLLFEPIGYANGFGIYTGIGMVLSIGLALATPRRELRMAALAAALLLAPTLYLTHSRGAWLAVAGGILTLGLFERRRARRLAAVAAALAAAAIVAVALSWGDRSVDAGALGANRPHYWHVAWKEYELHPALGSGAGTFDEYWLRYRPISSFARDAHNVYLETLAELGPVGLALLLATLGMPFSIVRGHREPVVAAAVAGYVSYLIHAAVDWDWELPAVTLAGLFCGAALLVAARPKESRELSAPARGALLSVTLVLGALALVRLGTGPRLPFSP